MIHGEKVALITSGFPHIPMKLEVIEIQWLSIVQLIQNHIEVKSF